MSADTQFFALGLNDRAALQIVYPRTCKLQEALPGQIHAFLLRESRPGKQSLVLTEARKASSVSKVALAGSLSVRFRDNTRFNIRVDLRGNGTNSVALKGEFVAYHRKTFEPVTYLAGMAMLAGWQGPPSPPPKEKQGSLSMLRASMVQLAKRQESGQFLNVCILEAGRCFDVRAGTRFKNIAGIELNFTAAPGQKDLVARTQKACRELNLDLDEQPAVNLNSPDIDTGELILVIDLPGRPEKVSDLLIQILERVFSVNAETRFQFAFLD